MDFRFSAEEEELRSEIRTFLKDNLPPLNSIDSVASIFGLIVTDDGFEAARDFNKKLAAKGWMAPAWPQEYGGLGLSIYEQMVFAEEFGYTDPPDTGTRKIGAALLGPALILHASKELQEQHLPGIAHADVIWCEGYSEPEAGSDLAGLQTRAVKDGDWYVLNGQKTWTSEAHHADWMFLLARTDPELPKHKGLSFFLLDMKSEGIRVQPMIHMGNRHHFNEVFLEDVRVPAANMIGEENQGWYVAMTVLDFERSGLDWTLSLRRSLDQIAGHMREIKPRPRDRLQFADLMVTNEVARYLGYRIGHMQAKGQVPNYEASILKVINSEAQQRIFQLGVNMLGLDGQLLPESPRNKLMGLMTEQYILASAATVYGGTNEIQRNVIATRGLALPKS